MGKVDRRRGSVSRAAENGTRYLQKKIGEVICGASTILHSYGIEQNRTDTELLFLSPFGGGI